MAVEPGLLVFDLDGVLGFEIGAPETSGPLLHLHDRLMQRLSDLPLPFIVLTHRSKREAVAILQALGVHALDHDRIFAAEDIFVAGLRSLRIGRLIRHGLSKSLVLRGVAARYEVSPAEIVFIDDSRRNLTDMGEAGVGLLFHAPSAYDENRGTLETFDWDELVERIATHPGTASSAPVALTARTVPVAAWRHTGVEVKHHGQHRFNHVRRVWRTIRKAARALT